MFSKFTCWLIGHRDTGDGYGQECGRCGDERFLYDDDAWTDRERYGVVDPLREFWRAIRRRLLYRYCLRCGKRIWRWRSNGCPDFCSDRCGDNWIPF